MEQRNITSQQQFATVVNNNMKHLAFIVFVSLISLFGSVTTILNARVFYKNGINDSITVSHFVLCIWQFGVCFMTFLIFVYSFIEIIFSMCNAYLGAIIFFHISCTRAFLYSLSTCVIMFLSIETCICITVPFNVRVIFTKSRSITINLLLFVLCLACYCTVWISQDLQSDFDSKLNRTHLFLWVSVDVDTFVSVLPGLILPCIGQVVAVVTVVICISRVKSSVKFRQRMRMYDANRDQEGKSRPFYDKPKAIRTLDRLQRTEGNTINNKNFKLTKVALFVTIQYVISNLPFLLMFIGRVLLQDRIKIFNRPLNMYYAILYSVTVIAPSIHIFVYWHINSKFRKMFRSMFRFGTDTERTK